MIAAFVVGTMALWAQPAIATAGELDASFGVGGGCSTDFGGTYDWGYAAAVQPDGKIVAAGVSNGAGTYDFALTRHQADGSVDPVFGHGGKVTTDFTTSFDWAYALVLQPDGKILVGGVTDASGSRDFGLARYLSDGSLDATFGQGGRVVANLRPLSADTVYGLAVQPDGKILAGGTTFPDAVVLRPNAGFILARFMPDGSPDAAFGIGGAVTTDFGKESWDDAKALALQPDGRIVLGGSTNLGNSPGVLFGADQLALARYTPQGVLDSTFGGGGTVTVDGGSMVEAVRALVLTPDGAIVAAGFVNGEHRGDMLLARFARSGALDATFGTGGLTIATPTSPLSATTPPGVSTPPSDGRAWPHSTSGDGRTGRTPWPCNPTAGSSPSARVRPTSPWPASTAPSSTDRANCTAATSAPGKLPRSTTAR